MLVHQASGRWKKGLALALITVGFWATLPIALKLALQQLDPWTLTWFRFLFCLLITGTWLLCNGKMHRYRGLSLAHCGLLMLAAAGLAGNYIGYLMGLDYTTPANAQLLIQLAPLLMAIGGIFVFGERFSYGQWLGLGLMALGMMLFFRDQMQLAGQDYALGSLLIVMAAISWALYALAQKQLLTRLSSQQVMGFIYLAATLVLLPMSNPASMLQMDSFHWIAVIYCAFNTLAAYGAFAEALEHWEASRVGTVIAITPLLTVLCVELAVRVSPGLIEAEEIAILGWIGALLIVCGSAMTALLRHGATPIIAPVAINVPKRDQ